MLIKLMTEHPNSVGETYFQHMGVALSFFATFAFATFAAFVHAFLPFLFVKTGSNIIRGLNDRMVANRHNQTSAADKKVTIIYDEYVI